MSEQKHTPGLTRDEVIRMAIEARIEVHPYKDEIRIGSAIITGCDSTDAVMRFAELVAAHVRETDASLAVTFTEEQSQQFLKNIEAQAAAAEREACAKVCQELRFTGCPPPEHGCAEEYYNDAAFDCSVAIRARGEVPK